MKRISLIVASLVLANSVSATTLQEAFKGGSVSGDITLYGEKQNNSGAENAGFTMGSIGLNYETAQLNGFKAAFGFRGNHDFSEVEKGDYSDGSEPQALAHTANISYVNEYFGLTVGRQEIDLEWMSDFHESAVLGITAVPDTSIIVGFSNRKATADADAPLEKFERFNGDKGAYVVDVKYEGVESLMVNPYFYNAPDLASWYGLKADYNTDVFGLMANYTTTNEDTNSTKDGQLVALEGSVYLSGLGVSLGYVKTDEDGVGSMTALGDTPNNPFDRIRGGDGNKVYEADAKTTYLNLTYEVAGIELGALYGQTKYQDNKEKELDLTLDYGVTENLTAGLLYIDVDTDDNSSNDYDKVTLTLSYSF